LSLAAAGCGGDAESGKPVVTFPGSALGAEAELLRAQLARFSEQNPDIEVVPRETPDAADQRHQLYVQWLNAGADDPDILQLDVIWTPEFAAAGWILPLDRFAPDLSDFFGATLEANRHAGRLYALPWFVDVGMLYWRTDLLDAPPGSLDELVKTATEGQARGEVPYGFVWQGARYEGLVTVFLEILGGFGGRILDSDGRAVVDSEAAIRALEFLRAQLYVSGIAPEALLSWQEEPVRFAFQNGQAIYMRNWPYAYALMQSEAESKVAGRFAVAPIPAASTGAPTAALGGQQLAINARSDQPEAAYRVIEFLTRPEQMIERARVAGQFPPRVSPYASGALDGVLAVPSADARQIIERAVPRPATPIYTELSGLLQVRLHRALTRQQTPREALADAAREMNALIERVGPLGEGDVSGGN
jgi:multiple sugar transport system substrate-binding protein